MDLAFSFLWATKVQHTIMLRQKFSPQEGIPEWGFKVFILPREERTYSAPTCTCTVMPQKWLQLNRRGKENVEELFKVPPCASALWSYKKIGLSQLHPSDDRHGTHDLQHGMETKWAYLTASLMLMVLGWENTLRRDGEWCSTCMSSEMSMNLHVWSSAHLVCMLVLYWPIYLCMHVAHIMILWRYHYAYQDFN